MFQGHSYLLKTTCLRYSTLNKSLPFFAFSVVVLHTRITCSYNRPILQLMSAPIIYNHNHHKLHLRQILTIMKYSVSRFNKAGPSSPNTEVRARHLRPAVCKHSCVDYNTEEGHGPIQLHYALLGYILVCFEGI